MRSKKYVAIVLTVLLALSAGVGIAAELGMFDFLARKMGQEVLPGAYDLVKSDIAYGETDYVTYTIKQAVYDGKSASLLVEMRAKDEETMLMGQAWWTEDPIGGYFYNTEAEAMAETRTVAQYAADNGYTRMVEASVKINAGDYSGIDEWKDNVLTVVYSFNASGDVLNLPIEYFSFDIVTGDIQRKADEITLTAAAPLWQVTSQQTIDLPDYGIRIDSITVTGTMLQSYWTVHYTVTDVEKANQGWSPDVIAVNGQQPGRGVLGVSGGPLAEKNGQQLTRTGSFCAMQNAPEQLTLHLEMWQNTALNQQLIVTLK